MADSKSLNRRNFIKICVGSSAAVVANPALIATAAGALVPAERVRLVGADGQTLRPESLAVGQTYVFHYPYVTTPCFLINLGSTAEPDEELTTADGRTYRWAGGVGPGRSIVAFSAICAHKMSYPTTAISFIDYRHEPMSDDGLGSNWWERGQVIYCCSEGSVYDPGSGGRVLAGPAPQPLAAVRLDFDAVDNALFATGVYGGDMLEQFLTKFGFQLALEHKNDDIWRAAKGVATVWPMQEYSAKSAC